ncbi:MAG: hypothetical protein KY053_01355 [Candidatus Liptonbacteria bacterium]|nr:hypothetical protein [Candidatus Liptonbacteria bacterium]
MMKIKKGEIAIIYHRNCLDGFGAAWSAWKKFKNKAVYLSAEHQVNNAAIDNLTGKETIYLLDFGYQTTDKIKQLTKNNQNVILIDHHMSQKPFLPFYTKSIYNENHSGAVLAWQYFHPKKPLPKLLKYIEDYDLWKFKIPHTKELMACLDVHKMDFSFWQKIVRDFELAKTRRKYLEEGRIIIKYQNQIIKRLINYAEKISFAGYSALAVNSPILVSEIGNLLSQKSKTFAVVWRYKKGGIEVSLRSSAGQVDVSRIAAKYGGGGHQAAAGFMIYPNKKLSSKNNLNFLWRKTK